MSKTKFNKLIEAKKLVSLKSFFHALNITKENKQ